MEAWNVPGLMGFSVTHGHSPTIGVETSTSAKASDACPPDGSTWLHSPSGQESSSVGLGAAPAVMTSQPSLWSVSAPLQRPLQQQRSGSPTYTIGQMLSPTPAGLPHGSSGIGSFSGGSAIGPPSTPGLGVAGGLSWGRLSVSPSVSGASGLDARFHSPLPGLTHPLWSPPLSAYHVTTGSSGFMDGSSSLPFYQRLSPPGFSATQYQYLSSLMPVSSSSVLSSPPSILSASYGLGLGLTSPVAKQHVGTTSTAVRPSPTEFRQGPPTPGLFTVNPGSSTASTTYPDKSPRSPLDAMTSSFNRQLLDYYAGLVVNASLSPRLLSPPIHRPPFAAVPNDAATGPTSRDHLDQSPPSRRDRHLRHHKQQQQQRRQGVVSRGAEDGSSSRCTESSFSTAASTGNGQLLLSTVSCGDRTENKCRRGNVDEDVTRRRLPLLSAKNQALVNGAATPSGTVFKVKSENVTCATDSMDAPLTSEYPVAGDSETRDSSGDEKALLRSTSFQTVRYCGTENDLMASEKEGLTPGACKLTVASRLLKSSDSEETMNDEDEEIDVCADVEEDLVSSSPTLPSDTVKQNVSMAIEQPVSGKDDNVIIPIPTESEDPLSDVKVETTVDEETTSDSATSGLRRRPLDDGGRSGYVSLAGNISSSGLQGIVSPIPRRSLVYEISRDLDRRNWQNGMPADNGTDVTCRLDDHRQGNKVHLSGTYRVGVGLRQAGLELSPPPAVDDAKEESGVRRLVESLRLRRQASDDVGAVSSKKSRFNRTDGEDDPKRNVENGHNRKSRLDESVGSPSGLSDGQLSTSMRGAYETLSATRPLSSESVTDGSSRTSAFQVLTQAGEDAQSTGSCFASPTVGSADAGGHLHVDQRNVDEETNESELKFHRSDGRTSVDDVDGKSPTVSAATSVNLDRRAPMTSLSPSTVVTGGTTIPVGIAVARPRHDDLTTADCNSVSSTAADRRHNTKHHLSSIERLVQTEHGCGTPSSWQRTSDNDDRKPTMDRIINPLNVANGDKASARDTTASYYGRPEKCSPPDRGWHGIPVIRPPEFSHLHVMTQPPYPAWTPGTSPGSLWYPPGHPAAAPFLPGAVHGANYRLLDRPDLPSPHLFDHRSSAADIHGFKMVPDLRTGHCYFLPEFTWPAVYDRPRFCDESLVNLAGLISPGSSSSDCIERKVKCEQLSPVAPSATTHYDSSAFIADRKPNPEQLRLSLALSPCDKSELRERDRGLLRRGSGWSKDRLLSVADVRQVTPKVWTGERTVAFESRGTSPLVDHSRLDTDVRPIPLIKLKTTTCDVPVNVISDMTKSGYCPATTIPSDTSSLSVFSGYPEAILDSSGDSAIDLSVQSSESQTSNISADDHQGNRKQIDTEEHSVSVDIPETPAPVEVAAAKLASKLADEEVGSILNSTTIGGSNGVEAAAPAERTGEVLEVLTEPTAERVRSSTRSPIVYELERITPVDEKDMPSFPYVGYQPIVNMTPDIPVAELTFVAVGDRTSTVLDSGAEDVSALDILSTLAMEQPAAAVADISPQSAHPEMSLCVPSTSTTSVPARRFSILDLPLADMMESSNSSSVESAYNAPKLQSFVDDDDDVWNKTRDANNQQKNPPPTPIGARHRGSSESGEVKMGDVFASLKVDCGVDNMDAMELDMRMKMADLQVRYREKQRELATLQRRRSVGSNERASSTECKAGRRKSIGGSRSRASFTTSSATGRRCPTTPSSMDQPGNGLVVAHHETTPIVADESSSSTLRHGPIAATSLTQLSDAIVVQKCHPPSTGSRKRRSSGVIDGSGYQKKRKANGHHKRMTAGVVKKSQSKQKFGFYSYKKSQQGISPGQKNRKTIGSKSGRVLSENNSRTMGKRTKSKAAQPAESQISLEDTAGFYTDEWYRRRSERIFLHKSADDTVRPTPVTPVTSTSSTVTLSSMKSPKQTTESRSAMSPALRTASSTVLLTSPKQAPDTPPAKSTDAVLGVAYRIKPSTAIEAATLAPTTADRHVTHYEYSSTSSSSSSEDSDSDLSDAEDMPLSAYINHSVTTVKTCALQQEDIVNGLRVLYLKDGLFFEGTVNELMPPDVYGVAIDGERGNRPNIVSREELLQQSVLIVRPTSSRDIPIGSRVCAYWSQKFSCLHPGTVCKANSDSSTDDDDEDVRVDFDDGDAGKIPLDFIRMLPPNFAIQDKDTSLMTLLASGRKRRSVSVDQNGSNLPKSTDRYGVKSDSAKLESVPSSSPVVQHGQQSVGKDAVVSKAESSQLHATKTAKTPKKSHDARGSNSSEATIMTVMTPGNSKSELKLTIKRTISHTTTDSGSSSSSSMEEDDEEEEEDEKNNKRVVKEKDEFIIVNSDEDRVGDYTGVDVEEDSSKAEESDSDEEKPKKRHVVLNRKGRRRERVTVQRQKYPDSDSDQDDESPARREHIKGKKQKTSRKSSSSRDEKRLKRSSSTSSQEVGSFLSVWQQWRWVGNSTQRPGLKGRARKLFYKAIQRGSEIIQIGDTVSFISNTRNLKYIGLVISLWESWDGSMWVRVKWFYHPEETKGGKRLVEVQRALFQSPHEDENDVQTISHKCEVLSYTEYKRYREQESSAAANAGQRKPHRMRDLYYLAGSYDPYLKEISSFERDVKVNQE